MKQRRKRLVTMWGTRPEHFSTFYAHVEKCYQTRIAQLKLRRTKP
jgi:hypothetical protein